MAPTPTPESDDTGLTGVHVAILVICIFIFAIILTALIICRYRRDKRRAQLNQQISRTPTPTPIRPLNIPSSRGNMSELPRPQNAFAPTSSIGRATSTNKSNTTTVAEASSAARPQNPSPDSAAAPGRASTWSSPRYGGIPGTRPQKAVPHPDAVPTRSALSSRNVVPNGVVQGTVGTGQGYWYAR